jgi:hypothetical protein
MRLSRRALSFSFAILLTSVARPVLAVNVSTLVLNPSTVAAGNPSTGTVTLVSAAPAGGQVVTLSSNNPSKASVPASITVPSGATTANFNISTSAVTANTNVVITATAGVNKTATLIVQPLLANLALNQTSVIGSLGATGIVTLNGPAPAGGAAITLTSSSTPRAGWS